MTIDDTLFSKDKILNVSKTEFMKSRPDWEEIRHYDLVGVYASAQNFDALYEKFQSDVPKDAIAVVAFNLCPSGYSGPGICAYGTAIVPPKVSKTEE